MFWLVLVVTLAGVPANGVSTLCASRPAEAGPDPNLRMEQLLSASEGPGQIAPDVLRAPWIDAQFPHRTYQRVHGGISP